MPKFRKKPRVVEAERYDPFGEGAVERGAAMTAFLEGCFGWHVCADGIKIPTLEGVMVAVPGDWIIKGVKGEFYPCKPDIFKATYEPE